MHPSRSAKIRASATHRTRARDKSFCRLPDTVGELYRLDPVEALRAQSCSVAAYLSHRELADGENEAERFFIYEWSPEVLEGPRIASLIEAGSPCYAWPVSPGVWQPSRPARSARAVRRLLPA